MIVSSSIIILLVSSFCIEAAEFPLTCNETTWSREQNVNSMTSAQEKEEIVKLRCALGCQIVVRIENLSDYVAGRHYAFG